MLDVLDGTGRSLADDGKLADVAQPAPGVEYAELRKPEASALYVVTSEEESTPPVRGVSLLQFADEATAAADAEARSAWLLEGTDQVTRLSIRQLYTPVGEVVVDGSRVAIEWTYGRNMSAGVRAHQAGAGIASCTELD